MDILKSLFYGMPFRLVLNISFFIVPFLSYGQGFYTTDNVLPAVGLENVYSNHQDDIELVLFVTSNTIISKNATTTFFVNGSIKMDMLLVAQSDISDYPARLPEKAQIKIKPLAKEKATEVKQSDNQPAAPYLPWKKNPLQHETVCKAVVAVYLPSSPVLKKRDKRPFGLHQSGANLLLTVYKKSCYSLFFTSHVTATYGKNSTEFSSRPPPVSRGI